MTETTHHDNACTGSNEVGQKGSSWENVKPIAADDKAVEPVAWLSPDLEHMAEEAECVSMCLDDRGVPKTEGDESLSLWGRVCRYKDGGWLKASAHLRCPRCGNEQEIKMETASISTPPTPAVPEGYALVPVEPTLPMLDALRADTTPNLLKRYRAMLSAAPKP